MTTQGSAPLHWQNLCESLMRVRSTIVVNLNPSPSRSIFWQVLVTILLKKTHWSLMSILQGIVLRDGCPLHMHSDAAREFTSKAMKRLCQLIGCRQTTTLTHHPTGNSHIERPWQWVALCLRQMTKEQHQEWEKYVWLMEHVWNTSHHSILQCTPFETSHGLPARTVLDSWVEEDRTGVTSKLMSGDDMSAMRTTAQAFVEQIENVRKEATERSAEQKRKGLKRTFDVGDRASFFIPPTEKEVNVMGRKVKHLMQHRGPANIVRKLSDTTFQLEFEGRSHYRYFSELWPHRSTKDPVDLPMSNGINVQENAWKIDNFVSSCDSDDPSDDLFYLCKVLDIVDDKTILLNYTTWTTNIHQAVFSIMCQEDKTLRCTTVKPTRKEEEQQVIDHLDLADADDYIDHYDVRMTDTMRISKRSTRELAKLRLRHHTLGRTFPQKALTQKRKRKKNL